MAEETNAEGSSEVAVHYPSPAERTFEAFALHEAELAPGAVEILARSSTQKLGYLSTEQRAEEVVKLLEGPLGERWRNPEYVAPKLETGAEAGPLRLALMRYGDRLQPDAVPKIMDQLATQAAGKSPAKVAGIVARFIESDEGGKFRASDYRPNGVLPIHLATASKPTSQPVRAPDGRFAEPPAKKDRVRSGL